ncbi:DUF4352 domain-containing protein [Williamsia sp. CHRR-6]|uniref:DUF4352 domain-containing protein n=1 Tax=Williamsia sp. CHRR-6 TaxID=2835871 RepID=UPI001BD930F6|nr:DUF4352 domain-containing protein [Williamsia sp. CHRR-6]MBT0565648.1 DUF4352 domain-containing protein [Williamsia sp. CHRR-6]
MTVPPPPSAPPPPTPPPPPYGGGSPYPPPPPKKNFFVRHKVFTGFLAAIALIVVISVAAGGGSSKKDDTTAAPSTAAAAPAASAAGGQTDKPAPTTKAKPARPGLGQPARDGKFEFIVRGVRDGGTTIGPDFMAETAQGRFQILEVTVRNVGKESKALDVTSQKLLGNNGSEYSADTSASISQGDKAILYEPINPGNTLEASIIYDLPVGVVPTAVELHDSIFSGGVTVNLK